MVIKNIFNWRSLNTRVGLFTLAVFLFSAWAVAFNSNRILREDTQRMLGEQQFSIAALVAAEINAELDERLRSLERVAAHITPAMVGNTKALQTNMDVRQNFHYLFNGGILVLDANGTAISETPIKAGRIGVNYLDVNAVVSALREGKSSIGRPEIGKTLKMPVFAMVVPIRAANGQVIGALFGVVNLGKPNFLDAIMASKYGKTGGYLLISPEHKLFITGTDKTRMMQPTPAVGVNPLLDRAMEGFEGYDVAMSSRGVEELVAIKRIPVAGWILAIVLPTMEAFAPAQSVQKRLLLSTLLLTLLAGVMTWFLTKWMVSLQLRPVLSATQTLATLSENMLPVQLLPVHRQDEIGELIGSFNRLLEALRQREVALNASEERHRTLIELTADAIAVHKDGRVLYVNPACVKMFGATCVQDLVGQHILQRVHPDFHDAVLARIKQNTVVGQVAPMLEEKLLKLDGTVMDVEVRGTLINYDGQPAIHAAMRDVTERKLAANALRVAAIAFECQDGLFVTDAGRVILRVNQAFTEITGYSAPEAVGQTPSLLKSGHHDAVFDSAMLDAVAQHGVWQGEIWNRRKNGEVFPVWLSITAAKDEHAVVTNYVASLTDITVRKAADEKIRHLAFYDPLTGLPNRRLLYDRLGQAIAASTRSDLYGAIFFVDVDHFKTLNDTLGHDVGDQLLIELAQRLQAAVREGDTVARQGGDEFVVLLEGLTTELDVAATLAKQLGDKLRAAIDHRFSLNGHLYHCQLSIGVSLFRDHCSIQDLLKQSDLALYQAKHAGRNTLRFFDPDMQTALNLHSALEAELKQALPLQQLQLYYQPQVDTSGRVLGMEALLRWQHPQRGLVSPAEFIALAEDTGLILPIGLWVLQTACAQLTAWATEPHTSSLQVAVNVSARQFRQAEFVAQVKAALASSGANPALLKLELTETVVLEDVEDTIEKMLAIKALGASFSMDDFGTGYSSLSYLAQLPLDQLKIDQSFVRDLHGHASDEMIVRAIITLGHGLGMNVIAEGVETQAQHDFLISLGCHAFQGYLFSRPLPMEALTTFLRPPVAEESEVDTRS